METTWFLNLRVLRWTLITLRVFGGFQSHLFVHVCPSVSAERMTPGELTAAGEAGVTLLSRVDALMLHHRLVARERGPALAADVLL